MFWIELFTIGTVPFFIMLGILWAILTACVAYEKPSLATVTLVATFLGYNYFNGIALHTYLDNPLLLAEFVGGYLLCGAIWAFVKWALFVKERSDAYDVAKANFLQQHKVQGTRIPDELLQQWQNTVNEFYNRNHISKPIVLENKSRILTWMYLWMQSIVWTLISDVATKGFEAILRLTHTLFQKVSDSIWKSHEDDFREVPKDPEVEFNREWMDKKARDNRKSPYANVNYDR